MSNPNNMQVGGTHYRQGDKPQHWDLVSLYGWDYFQGQITKYLMRWKYKHKTPEGRLEDLKKARHFLDKYITLQEEAMKSRAQNSSEHVPDPIHTPAGIVVETENWRWEGCWGNGLSLYTCKHCKAQFKAEAPPTDHNCKSPL